MKKKILIALAAVFGVFVLAVVIVLATFDLDQTVKEQTDLYLPELEKALGREVTVGTIETTVMPVLGARVTDLKIAGKTPEDGPLVTIDQVRFGVELWTAISSGGDEVRLKELVVEGLQVEIVRQADGTLAHDEVLARLAEGPPKEEAQPQPLSPEAKRFIRNLELDRIAIDKSRVTLIDRQADTTARIDDLLVELTDVKLDSAFEIRVAAAVLAEKRNFDLSVALGPIPVDPEARLPIDHIQLNADGVDLAALLPYLGAQGSGLKSAALSADLRVEDPLGALGATKAAGSLTLAELSVGHPKPGETFDLIIEPNISFDMASGVLDLTGFAITMAEMKLTANGRLTGVLTGRPAFEGLTVETEKFDFGRLFALLPDARAALPPGMVLDGPLALKVKADGDPDAQTVRVMANLDGATVVLPDALNKPAGTALNTSIHADLTADDLDLKGLALQLGTLSLKVAGTVKNFDDPTFDLKGGITPTPIGGVARLFPQVAAAVPADVAIAGQIALDLRAKGNRSNLDGKVGLVVTDADLKAPGATLAGSGRVEVVARGNAAGDVTATVSSDLDALAIEAGDAFKKPAGVPFVIAAQASAAKDGAVNLPRFKLELGPLKLAASGTRAASGALDARVELRPLAIGDLARILPSMADSPYGSARIELAGAVKGDPAKPETIDARLEKFAFAQGRNSVNGTLNVKNLTAPVVRFQFTSPYLDLDQLLPGGGPEEAPEPEAGPPEIPEIVKQTDLEGNLKVARGRMADIDFTNFDARLVLKNGRLTFESLEFDAYEGHFSGATTTVDLRQANPPFKMKMALRDVSANAILTDQASLPNTLKGRMSTEMDLTGNGLEWPSIRDSLNGSLGMALANGRFERLELGNAVLKEVAARVPMLKLSRGVKTQLKDLAGNFRVADGRMTLIQPMSAQTNEGPILITGSIGLDQTLDLEGTLTIRPQTIARLSQNKIKLDKGIPVALKIGGTLLEPTIGGIDDKALVTALLGAAALAIGLDKADEAKAAAEKAAREAANRARAEANKAATEARRAAEAKKKELEAKARREAEKAKKAAKKRAEEEAKKRLRGLF